MSSSWVRCSTSGPEPWVRFVIQTDATPSSAQNKRSGVLISGKNASLQAIIIVAALCACIRRPVFNSYRTGGQYNVRITVYITMYIRPVGAITVSLQAPAITNLPGLQHRTACGNTTAENVRDHGQSLEFESVPDMRRMKLERGQRQLRA